MCLVLLAINAHPRYGFIIASNRDEFYNRPSTPVRFWKDSPILLAGRDMQAGGTWFGITTAGKFATITNFRDPSSKRDNAPSRGKLVSEYLQGQEPPEQYIQSLEKRADEYNGFNLILGDLQKLYYYSNRQKELHPLSSGIFGLSNHLLDTPWPKLVRGKEYFKQIISEDRDTITKYLFRTLQDSTMPEDDSLPDTGVGLDMERMLAPIFIKSHGYGTRSTTIVFIDKLSQTTFIERTYNTENDSYSDVKFEFQVTS